MSALKITNLLTNGMNLCRRKKMPFKSNKQRKFLYKKKPKVAKKLSKHPSKKKRGKK